MPLATVASASPPRRRRSLVSPHPPSSRPRALLILGLCLLFPAWTLGGGSPTELSHEEVAHLKVDLGGAEDKVTLVHREDGSYRFLLNYDTGETVSLEPDEFAALLHEQEIRLRWWNHLLNVSSAAGVAWVALGLLGQVLFTGRMIVQWLVSERRHRSVVPPVFWWLSLGGATILLAYFLWRRDIVGVLGQSVGWVIYARNLRLIHRFVEHTPEEASPVSVPEPSVDEPMEVARPQARQLG